MKEIVEIIDDKHYYGKVLPEQDLVILFKRPNGANDKECESFLKDLLDVIINSDDYLFSSDIVSHAKWNNDEIETIGKFLYVRKGDSVLVPEGLERKPSQDFDELIEGDQRIAVIQIIHLKRFNYKKYSFGAVVCLCLFLIVKCIAIHLEENRVNANQELYSNDLCLIDSLRNEFHKVTSDSHSYVPYISGSDKNIIANKLDSLHEAANSNIEKVRNSGDYSPVMSNVQTYKTAINQLVDEAKRTEQISLENVRIERNRKTYEKGVQTIKSLEDALLNVANNQTYSNYVSESQVQNIKAVLDSLNNTAEASFSTVAHSGVYNKLSIDSVGIWGQIQAIADSAQEESKRKNKYKRTVVTPVRSQRNITPSSSKRSNDKTRYDNFVKLADQDYNNYYMTRDVTAARRAISNYSEALRINYNSNIAKRCDKLKKELGL